MKEPHHLYLSFRMTRKRALQLNLLFCGSCGHRENNHFDHGTNPCAHCECTEYKEDGAAGTTLT